MVMATILKEEDRLISQKLTQLNQNISLTFSGIYEEFQEHLEAINENSTEIQSNYAYLCELDNKIAKLNKKIEEIHLILSKMTGKKLRKMPNFDNIDPLTEIEKNVFLNLYTEEKPITYQGLAKKMNMPIPLAREYVLSLLEKGIPIQKVYIKTRPYVMLDKKFKNLQAKKNILKIEQKILT